MLKDEVIQIVKEQLNSFDNFIIPPHRHNKVDNLPILMGDLMLDARGLIFPNNVGQVVVGVSTDEFKFIPNSRDISFFAGQGSNIFFDIGFASLDAFQVRVGDSFGVGTPVVGFNIFDNGAQFTASNTDFTLQLPNTTRPSPVAGMIAFEAGTFYACEVTGTWRTIVTA